MYVYIPVHNACMHTYICIHISIYTYMYKIKLKTLGNLLNQRKLAFFNAIQSEEMAKINKDFMKIDEIFTPKN